MSDLKIMLNGEGAGIESEPTVIEVFHAAKNRSRKRLGWVEMTNAEFLRQLLDVWALHEARDVPDVEIEPAPLPASAAGRPERGSR